MQYAVSRGTTNGGQAAISAAAHIDGRALNRLLRGSTASQRAIIADDLHTGRLVVGPLTGRHARLLARASYGYSHTASKLSAAERVVVKLGQRSLAAFHNKPSASSAMTRAANEVLAELGDFEDISLGDLLDRAKAKVFDRLADRYPEQLMAALDRVTAPAANDNNTAAADPRQMSLAL